MIMKYKKIVLAIALSAGMYSGTSALASGIPTVDAAAIAQMVQQLTQMQQMYSNMVQQYNTAVNTLQNFTGTRGLGLVDYNLNLRSLIPTSARSRLNGIMNGTSSLSSLGRDIFNRLKLGDACSNLDGEVKQNCLRAREFEAEQQAVLEEAANTANQRLQNIESLMSRINTATEQPLPIFLRVFRLNRLRFNPLSWLHSSNRLRWISKTSWCVNRPKEKRIKRCFQE